MDCTENITQKTDRPKLGLRPSSSQEKHTKPSQQQLHVLIIDDGFNYELLRSKLLKLKRFKVSTFHAYDLCSARQAAKKQHFDVTFLNTDPNSTPPGIAKERIGGSPVIYVTNHTTRPVKYSLQCVNSLFHLYRNCLEPPLLEAAITRLLKTESIQKKLRTTIIELNRANAAKRNFFELINRELKKPLTDIMDCAQALDTETDISIEPEPYQDALGSIHQAGSSLQHTVSNLTKNFSCNTSKSIPRLRSIDLADLLSRCIESVDDCSRANEHRIIASFEGSSIPITCFPEQLELAITNIIFNAIKFSPARSEIHVTAAKLPGSIEIAIRDNGCGMPKKVIDNILVGTEKTKNSPDIMVAGLGIGLANTNKIVSNHLGRLNIQSAPGKGTTVGISLPV